MSEPYYSDESVTLWHGDSLEVLRTLPDQSVDCCVTSPPYFGLRDYGEAGQYGLERTPAEYVETMLAVFREVRRVLADDGTLWLNLGDSYSGGGGGGGGKHATIGGFTSGRNSSGHYAAIGLGPKNLLGMPWRVAFGLQEQGWTLRNDIIWHKPNAMPESVTDRLSTRHEHLFMFSKSRHYWFDLDPIREPLVYPQDARILPRVARGELSSQPQRQRMGVSKRDSFARATKEANVPGQSTAQHREDRPDVVAGTPLGRNPGDVWTVATQPFSEAHFAVMPQALAERAILAGCKPAGTVLDPFSGSGTTGLAAAKHGRRYVGIDLNRDYLDLSLRTRLGQKSLLDGESA